MLSPIFIYKFKTPENTYIIKCIAGGDKYTFEFIFK
jgi:hypothetical protein